MNNCKIPMTSNPEAPFSPEGNIAPKIRKPVYNSAFAASVVRHHVHLYFLYNKTTHSQNNNSGVKSIVIKAMELTSAGIFLLLLLLWKKERIKRKKTRTKEYPHNAVCTMPHLLCVAFSTGFFNGCTSSFVNRYKA